ncbi:MAG: radical SAM protein [Alphaproteobacteria bacterium]|jgi:hypothetical protein|nr:radical SAM protein [Alphaproteobacteria bacterium]MDP6515407.1 radical SAM protein [Alphaproteobacteria bacterium]
MTQGADTSGFLEAQISGRFAIDRSDLAPPLPDKIAIEINNSCNHKCYFCPNPIMTRARTVMDGAMVLRILDDAHRSGIGEVSFYSTGEPFLNKGLADYVATAKRIGFSYVYLSTNGGKAVSPRLEPVLRAGLDSLKFSVNAGTRETYARVHGVDEFDTVIENIARVSEHRRRNNPAMKLFVSFVETDLNRGTFADLELRVGALVDEVIRYPFIVIGTPLGRRDESADNARPSIGYQDVDRGIPLNHQRTSLPCYQLWSYLNVTVEGWLSACCSDFNADLVVGSLHGNTLLEAWHSQEFQELRQRHLEGQTKGTLCHGCVAQKDKPYRPINIHLTEMPITAESDPASGRKV